MKNHEIEFEIEQLKQRVAVLEKVDEHNNKIFASQNDVNDKVVNAFTTLNAAVRSLTENDITMYDLKKLDANNCSCTCEVD